MPYYLPEKKPSVVCTKLIVICQQRSKNIACKKIEKLKLFTQNHNYLQPKAKKTNNFFPRTF